MCRFLESHGFTEVKKVKGGRRGKGSGHKVYQRGRVRVPISHGGKIKELDAGTTMSILRIAGLRRSDLIRHVEGR
jgi:predicted RNA binding protein YcfA (HicA-like mRNA interferase family)